MKQSGNLYPNITTTIKLKGKDVKVHALSTGMVAVKNNFMTKKGPGFLSKLNIIFDQTFTEYLPIWVWVIEHPEGTIMIDTGEISTVNDKDHLKGENAYARFVAGSISKFSMESEDNLNFKLDQVNMKTDDIKMIAFTHLHLDHTDGIRFFPKAEFIVNEYEYKHPYSNLPSTYPKWFKPNLVNYKQNKVEVFDSAYTITSADDLLYVPTPGHTNGHSSVIFKTDDFDIIFAGDTSYTQEQVQRNELAGANISYDKTEQTYKNLINYAGSRKTLYLTSHDPNAGKRLMERSYLVG